MQGDGGGEHMLTKDNILVDPGQYGIGVAGGKHIYIDNNKVYGKLNWFTNVGIYAYNFSPSITPEDIIFRNNKAVFIRPNGLNHWGEVDSSMSAAVDFDGTNGTDETNINSSILPNNIFNRITKKTNGI